jgi:hypothetical protein
MFTISLRRLLIVVLASIAFAGLTPSTTADHSWGTYHWARTDNQFNLKLGDNVSNIWNEYLRTTSTDWSKSQVLNTTIVAGGTRPRNCRPTTGQVEVCNAAYGFNGWLGIAQIWISGSHITQAITKLNDTYFNTGTYNKPEWRNFVMCQEVGHTFGLDHQDEDFDNPNLGSCMDYTSDPAGETQGLNNEHPNTHDYRQLETIYAHTDGSTTVSSTPPPAMNDIELSGHGQWGRQIRGSRERGKSTYVLDFGGGHKVYTFVIWAK